jgi:hypothetical protein
MYFLVMRAPGAGLLGVRINDADTGDLEYSGAPVQFERNSSSAGAGVAPAGESLMQAGSRHAKHVDDRLPSGRLAQQRHVRVFV